MAENVLPGRVILERDPGPKDLDNRFFFQSRPLPGQRANLSAQSRGSASSTRYEAMRPTNILVNTPEIQEILSHRIEANGLPQFLVRKSDSSPEQESWVSLLELIRLRCKIWVPYCMAQGISTVDVGALAAAMAAGPKL